MRVSLAQMDILLGDAGVNLRKAREMARQAGCEGSDLVVFPELWSTGYDLENADLHSSRMGEGMFAEMSRMADDNDIYLAGSCISKLGKDRYGNTSALFDPEGKLLATYTKIHLFGLMDEHKYLSPGESLTIVDTRWCKIGMAICYDLRFPEMFRCYALGGVELVVIHAEWPHPRLAHWQVLLKARAIENQMYVVACNRVGMSKDTSFFGHSCVVDPWSEMVCEAGEEEALITADIDMDKVNQVRRKIPVLMDRRPDIYSNI